MASNENILPNTLTICVDNGVEPLLIDLKKLGLNVNRCCILDLS